ncbi:glycoside hydrolase family 172 protein [Cohnella sp. 56]|uniref:glycoside hydrolase family 172 protein n=1 Tax=Cohnella sp. 56 TaxID=3113722 RepID=UPI0030E82618
MTASFNGLGMNLGSLSLLSKAKTRSISPENPTGEKGKGGMAEQGTGSHCARELGRGWKISPSIAIPAGTTAVIADVDGPGAIQSMWFGGYVGRDFILRIYWDGLESPSVESPLSDFFALGWESNTRGPFTGPHAQISSVPVAVNPNRGLNCFWEMPFREHCKMTIENIGPKENGLYFQINYTLTAVPDNAAYFHAQFRRTNPVPYMQDYTIVDGIRGEGHYVGTALFVGLNGAGKWWGEGEIKFFMDGDGEFPTICGTGTEDYFGGAYDWDVEGKYTSYTTPYMGLHQILPADGLYVSQQRFSMYRWHVMDPIRFDSDLRVTLQDLGWRGETRYLPRQDDMASVAYWYQTIPCAPFPPFPTRDEIEVI